jgi:queuine/archaeosine tRNA-ribosyltransferase
MKPDGLPGLYHFKSVSWIISAKDDRVLLSRCKLGGSATKAHMQPCFFGCPCKICKNEKEYFQQKTFTVTSSKVVL